MVNFLPDRSKVADKCLSDRQDHRGRNRFGSDLEVTWKRYGPIEWAHNASNPNVSQLQVRPGFDGQHFGINHSVTMAQLFTQIQ